MTRVSSYKTRQAILVVGDPLDETTPPDRLQLFNEAGEPLSIGGEGHRDTEEFVSASLASGVSSAVEFDAFPSWRAFKIETDRPARVRVYPTEAFRLADEARAIGTKPQGNHGRLLEVVTEIDMLELILSPAVDFTSDDPLSPTFYATVTNLDTATGIVTTTFDLIRTE